MRRNLSLVCSAAVTSAVPLAFAGCGNAPATVLSSTVTGLMAGIYTGDATCVGIVTDETGPTSVEDTLRFTRVIGESGLPVEGGVEVQEGEVWSRQIGGISMSVAVDSVVMTPDGVSIEASGIVDTESCLDDACTVTEVRRADMFVTERYESLAQDRIEYASFIQVIVSVDSRTLVFVQSDCSGVLNN